MKSAVLSCLAVMMLIAPVSAEPYRHRHHHHAHGHVVGTRAHHGEAGFPITAASDSIRINAVGEVISQPVPVIQKERNFQNRAQRNLNQPQAPAPAPAGGAAQKP